jgi:putative membrane protein
MMWGWQGGNGAGYWPMWGFGWVIPVLVIIGFVFLMIRMRHGPRVDRALSVLRERYAKGELTKEQFDSMRKDLGG